jgi:hypothetical protein
VNIYQDYSTLWMMVSAGMACLVIAIGTVSKDNDPLPTLTMAVAAATLWPLFTGLVIGMLAIGAAMLVIVSISLLPVNIVLAATGREPIRPYKTTDKAALARARRDGEMAVTQELSRRGTELREAAEAAERAGNLRLAEASLRAASEMQVFVVGKINGFEAKLKVEP